MSITVAGRSLEEVGSISEPGGGVMRPSYRLTIGDVTYGFAPYANGKTFVSRSDVDGGIVFDTLEQAVEHINIIEDSEK